MRVEYIYHVTGGLKSINDLKKYGLSSPRRLYEVDRALFVRHTMEVYKDRAAPFLRKKQSDITPEDVLDYLDNSPKRKFFSSRTLFFSFETLKKHHPDLQRRLIPGIEMKIKVDKVRKYKPVLIAIPSKGGVRYATWNEIQSPQFYENYVKGISDIKPKGKLAFKHNLHLALDAYHIPLYKFDDVRLIK